MDFVAVVDQVIALLREQGCLPYRTLQRQFQLDDEALEDLKDELIYVQRVAADENNRVLVWRGKTMIDLLSLIRSLPDNKYLLAVPVWCYLVGLVISNLYLGSLGVVSFDVLKTRYIAVGTLASFFFIISYITAYVHLKVLTVIIVSAKWTIKLIVVLVYWFLAFPLIGVSTSLLSSIAGDKNYDPAHGLYTIIAWIYYLFVDKSTLVVIGILLVAWSCTTYVIESEGSGIKRVEMTIRKLKRWPTGPILIFMAAVFTLFSLLPFVSALTSTTKAGDTSHGWERFSGLAFLLAALTSSLMLAMSYLNVGFLQGRVLSRLQTLLYKIGQSFFYILTITFLLGLAIPIYSLGIYPYLQQRIGGGSAIPVQVVTSLKILCRQFTNSSMKMYLVDRTSSSTIFQLVDEQKSAPEGMKVMEVANSQIKSIIYKHDGKFEANDCTTDSDQEVSK